MNTYKRVAGILSITLVAAIVNTTIPAGIVKASTYNSKVDAKQKDNHGIDTSTDFGKKAKKNLTALQKQALEKGKTDFSKSEDYSDYMAVSLVEFQDKKHNQINPNNSFYTKDFNQKHYENMLFKSGVYQTSEGTSMPTMNQYYKEQSGGSWSMQGTVAPWMQAKHNIGYYNQMGGHFKDFDGFKELTKETLTQVGQSIRGNEEKYDQRDPYDLDGDGNVMEPDGLLDSLSVVVAGAEKDLDVVPHMDTLKDPVPIPGTSLKAYAYIMVPEDSPVGIFTHEYGHNLGLPDLYDLDKGSPVGNWSLMDMGAMNGKVEGTEPIGFDPWSKVFLQAIYGGNWIKPIEVDYNDLKQKKEISLSEAVSDDPSRKVIKVNLPPVDKDGTKYPNYYLIEWRSHNGLDKGLSKTFQGATYDPGMLVWYYDGRYTDNATSKHPGYGMIGVVDAHQQLKYWNNDKLKPAFEAFQLADAAFGLRKTSPLKLETDHGKLDFPSQEGISTFNDQNDYSLKGMESVGKILPKLGLQFKVLKENKDGNGANIEISRAN
ncbi:immune inhibitor A [Croceifilum oryzae]|uniref:Immune inhibitor A n=1 Tax=Croceifilum oryzae TaxID=1553429 RepID=A0AAJ1TQ25_9BACL|nr:immune inhibitor A domain-containing protein [Croceifilum oryzae]MDQ0418905.1 immune inhibitor A [Croceifilum oryzae]